MAGPGGIRPPFENSRPTLTLAGVMSGTSHDGTDVALVEITPGDAREDFPPDLRVKLLYHHFEPHPKKLRTEIGRSFEEGTARLITRLNRQLGEVFAEAVLKAIESAGMKTSDLDAIASHGQTIHHLPPDKKNNRAGSTLQIGSPAVMAERTGLPVIADFRLRDMAAGGQGAPLVPMADRILFSDYARGRKVATLNLGGMANLTILGETEADTLAFDTGPGNVLLDECVKRQSRGRKLYDRNGRGAIRGTPYRPLLGNLLKHPYYRQAGPKSTGRETFGPGYLEKIISKHPDIRPEDLLCTLTHLTAETVARELERHGVEEAIVSGGGARNGFLMELLGQRFKGRLTRSEELGIPSGAREALCFAILGYLTLCGLPGNVPSATGAERAVILGSITYP